MVSQAVFSSQNPSQFFSTELPPCHAEEEEAEVEVGQGALVGVGHVDADVGHGPLGQHEDGERVCHHTHEAAW